MKDRNRASTRLLAATLAILLSLAPALRGQSAKVANTRYFRVEIFGLPAISEVTSAMGIDFGWLSVPALSDTSVRNADGHRSYKYGIPQPFEIIMTVQSSPNSTRLERWSSNASAVGGNADWRRSMKVYHLASDKSTVLGIFKLYGCFPVSYTPASNPGSDVKMMALQCRVDSIIYEESALIDAGSTAVSLTFGGRSIPIRNYTGGERTPDGSINPITIVTCSSPGPFLAAAHRVMTKRQQERFQLVLPEIIVEQYEDGRQSIPRFGQPFVYTNCLLTGIQLTPLNTTSGELFKTTVTFQPEGIRTPAAGIQKPKGKQAAQTDAKDE